MKHLFWAILLLLLTGTICFAQPATAAATPVPPGPSSSPAVQGGKIKEPPVKLSLPLIKIQNEHFQFIAYMIAVKSDNFEKPNFQLKIYYRERQSTNQPSADEDSPVMLVIDGRTFEVSAKISNVSRIDNRLLPETFIHTQTFTFDFMPDDVGFLSQARSLSVIWNKINAEIRPEGLAILHKFVLSDGSR